MNGFAKYNLSGTHTKSHLTALRNPGPGFSLTLASNTTYPEYRRVSAPVAPIMSREQYQIPTTSPSYAAGRESSAYAGSSSLDANAPSVQYLCGDCNSKVSLKRGDPIRCKECGHRVLYKERTKR